MGIFDDLMGSAEAMASFPSLLYNLFLASGIVIIVVVAFVGIAMGVSELRSPGTVVAGASNIVSAIPL